MRRVGQFGQIVFPGCTMLYLSHSPVHCRRPEDISAEDFEPRVQADPLGRPVNLESEFDRHVGFVKGYLMTGTPSNQLVTPANPLQCNNPAGARRRWRRRSSR